MANQKDVNNVWLKFKIETTDGRLIMHHLKIPLDAYKVAMRAVKINSITENKDNQMTKELYLELLAYCSGALKVSLKFNLH